MKKTYTILVVFSILICSIAFLRPVSARDKKESSPDRPPCAAGRFYPDSAGQLSGMVSRLLAAAPDFKPSGKILAAIAPHAGYIFSGPIAAQVHKVLPATSLDTLVIIGHDAYRDAVAYTCPVDYFETPLGKVPVDREIVEKLHALDRGIRPDLSLHAHDHSIEVHLPFIQVLGSRCSIVPLLFGNPTVENCIRLSQALRAAAGGKKLFVLASSDMAHYPPYEWACKIDRSTLDCLRSMDVGRLFEHLRNQENQTTIPGLRTAMCARGGVGTALIHAKALGARSILPLKYANSGDVPTGDRSRVVGYGAVVMLR